MKKILPRRTFLKGAGHCLALPLLDAMLPSVASAAPTIPRFLSFYIPNGSYIGNKFSARDYGFWLPTPSYSALGLATQPLLPAIDDMTVVHNLSNPAYGDRNYSGAGPFGHSRSASTFLTAAPAQKVGSAFRTVKMTDSFDQIINIKNQGRGGFRGKSFVTCLMDAHRGVDDGITSPEYFNTVSFNRTREVRPLRTGPDLMNTFFFGMTSGPGPASPSEEYARLYYKKSHLDFMKDSIATFKRELSRSDFSILDDYLDQVRALEEEARHVGGGPACTSAPTGVPTGRLTDDKGSATPYYAAYGRFCARAFALAARRDLTRSGAIMLGTEPCATSFQTVITGTDRYEGADMNGDYHLGTAHHGNNEKNLKRLLSIHQLQMKIVKAFYDELKTANELNNTILMVGSGLSDGDRHLEDELFRIFIGGRSLGMTGRRLLNAGGKSTAQLFLGLFPALGITDVSSFGGGRARTSNRYTITG